MPAEQSARACLRAGVSGTKTELVDRLLGVSLAGSSAMANRLQKLSAPQVDAMSESELRAWAAEHFPSLLKGSPVAGATYDQPGRSSAWW